MPQQPMLRLPLGSLAWRGLLVAALSVAAVAQLLLPVSAPLPAPLVAATPLAASARRHEAPPEAIYAAIGEHPLFDPTRRPYVPPRAPPASTKPALAELRDYTLLGIVIGDGLRFAVLKAPGDGKTVIAAEGQVVGGWTLRRISAQRLRFESGAARYEMRFVGPRWLDR